jgi:DNA-binding PadR family transcriptional regulator
LHFPVKPDKIRFVGGGNFLGEFEHMLLAAVIRLGEDAYGASILQEIEKQAGRRVPSGSLYVTLDRLERKGLIRSYAGDPEPGRGGRPKRFVRITPEGLRAVREVREAMLNLWAGIEGQIEEA